MENTQKEHQLSNKKSLKDFKSSLRCCKLFVDAGTNLPQFLTQNLLDDARTIKIFRNDATAFIKIFNFQFLKLCFEIEDVDYTMKINKFIETIESNIDLLEISTKYSQIEISHENVKQIVFQFLELISECKQPVQSSLARYPVINNIFTNFFCNYLHKFHKIQQFNTKQAIQKLSQIFQVDIVDYDQCLQFTDAQVYTYKQNQQTIYLIYIDQSKAIRNIKMQATEFQDYHKNGSNKSVQAGVQGQVLKFDQPDVVFAELENGTMSYNRSSYGNGFYSENNNNNQDIQSNNQQQMNNADISSGNNKQQKSRNNSKQLSVNDIFSDNNKIKCDSLYGTSKMYKTNLVSTAQQSNSSCTQSNTFNNTSKLSNIFLVGQKQNRPDSMTQNLSKQFTNTFILDTIVAEPYRTKIKEIKTKARQERQSRRPFFV